MSFSISAVTDNDRDLVSEDKKGKLKMEHDKGRRKLLTTETLKTGDDFWTTTAHSIMQ